MAHMLDPSIKDAEAAALTANEPDLRTSLPRLLDFHLQPESDTTKGDPSSPSFDFEDSAAVSQCLRKVHRIAFDVGKTLHSQVHMHRKTCWRASKLKKSSKGGRERRLCKARYGRQISSHAFIHRKEKLIVLKQTDLYTVPFNRYVTYLGRCNHCLEPILASSPKALSKIAYTTAW
uniref:Uncharacterized protein n=1 Tax=Chromera velia CCMP2878 TaxID=1169474 RepID=A0A0G4HSK8_9ALVE|eukprot:Cvel_8308.t1-p1 / transcript=Cvel_8308.t1 / gene=Cvel_8308 / organism=Chromera_velia_CCMP2878 / gene_product=hypothetical protein / transcript_product=hypothetical protein / location=Cvel_scaffold456:39972-40496(-) / protein_length=175 / sequence_SO=supercontig / SO=protein_coding / is_pseudo=false